jgi:hypothetical protein
MDDDVVEILSNLDSKRLKHVLQRVADEKGGDLAELLGPIMDREPLPALQTARNAVAKWATDSEAYARKEKMLYAAEIDDIKRRVAADIAMPSAPD